MSSKRKASIKREAKRMFIPDGEPCYTYNGKTLTDKYDRECFKNAWDKEQHEHQVALREEAEERAIFE